MHVHGQISVFAGAPVTRRNKLVEHTNEIYLRALRDNNDFVGRFADND